MLTFSNVSKLYGNTQALAPVNLEVAAGETLVLIGPSGCGKSTLLRLIAGLVQPSTGNIVFENEVISHNTILEKACVS